MTDDALTQLRAACETLRSAADGKLAWEWDDRFSMALAAFDAPVEPEVRAALDQVFDNVWAPTQLDGAPESVVGLVSMMGGMRAGQQLRTLGHETDAVLYCAWWPWGSGSRVSLRVGYATREGSAAGPGLDRGFREWFGI